MSVLPHAADPRPRLVAWAILVAGAMFALGSIAAMAAALVFVAALHLAAGRGAAELAVDARRLWLFVVVVMVLNAVATPGDPAIAFGRYADITWQGLAAGAFFSLRLVVLYLATALLVRTTPPEEMAAGLHAAIAPLSRPVAARVAFHAFVAASFVPVFGAEMERVRIAQSFRGARLSGGLLDRTRSARALVVPLILSAVHRSSQLAMVTELRGLETRLGNVIAVQGVGARGLALPVVTAALVVAAALWLV
jgi:energy-coupling factor transporter transmembrane protein EcfT